MTLADLKTGDRVRIEAIRTAETAVQRLMIMGFVEGAELQFVGPSLGGDPLEFLLHGSAVSLRKADARHFDVLPESVDG
ncbi:MAG: FeoA domain-containing protein [Gammaproteobacteria bacterium]